MAKAKKLKYDNFREQLGAAIKVKRNEKGMSTRQLAEQIQKTQPRIPEIESGRTKELDTYLKCLEVLGGRLQIVWDNWSPSISIRLFGYIHIIVYLHSTNGNDAGG